jgi:hypothetical protein
VSFNDCLNYREAHACTVHAMALTLTAIELIEDHRPFEIADGGAAIGHARDEPAVFYFTTDKYGRIRG